MKTALKNITIPKLKRKIERLKKKYPHVSNYNLKTDLAEYLGFAGWADLMLADESKRRKAIAARPLKAVI